MNVTNTCLIVLLSLVSEAFALDKASEPSSDLQVEPPVAESATDRNKLPLYKTIPTAKVSELTPALPDRNAYRHWFRSQGDPSNTRYSALAQIHRANVAELEVAWIYRSGGTQHKNIQATPVIADGVLYAPAVGKIVVALNAETGKERWRFQPPEATELFGEDYGPAHRGLVYWPGDRANNPRLFFTANGYLFALDAETGKPVTSFGDHGAVPAKGPVAPALFQDIVLVSNLDAMEAFNLFTGRRLWRFEVTDRRRTEDSGSAIVDGKAVFRSVGGNIWGGMGLDETRGLVFFSTGAPHPNFVGIDRPGDNKHANSVVALDARAGRLIWAFQEIPHDLWDLDIPAPPNLVTITHRGKRVDAVVQVTKRGNTLLLDRLSGKPLFPFRLRRAPVSTIPGERTSPYQADLELPEPFARQVFTSADITDITPEAHEFVSRQLQNAKLGWFEPPMEDKPIVFYGPHGGAEWPGAAFDPTTGMLYVSANEVPWLAWVTRVDLNQRQRHAQARRGQLVFRTNCAACHGEDRAGKGMAPSLLGIKRALTDEQVKGIVINGRNAMPSIPISDEDRIALLDFLFDRDISDAGPSSKPASKASYVDGGLRELQDNEGYPGSKPPWGTLNAIDLNTGKLVWKVPLGEYQELTDRGIPKTGTKNFAGALVTAGGLVFAAGTKDLKIRAFDKQTGQELWQYKLPFGGYAPPATYEVNGRQFVVIAATGGGFQGGERGDAYVAFALPK